MRLEWPRSAGLAIPAPLNNQARHGNTVAVASISLNSDVPQLAGSSTEAAPNYRTFDPIGRVRWGTRECDDENGCGRCFFETCYPLFEGRGGEHSVA